MPKKTMYEGINNSPQTVTTEAITASAQSIPVASTSVFPPAPNLCTLGTGDDAEVIQYNAITGSALTGCVRGFGGTTAKIWPADTVAFRAFTLEDYKTLCGNIDALFDEKLDENGDASQSTAAFVAAASRNNLVSGETLSVLLGKMVKWYADLKAVAWSGKYADLSGAPTNLPPTAHAASHAAGGADAVTPAAIGAQPKITANGLLKGNGSGTISAAVAGTDYVKTESDPTVHAWAKAANKPTYTAAEVGAQAKITASGILKGTGSAVQKAVAGTDYAAPSQVKTATLSGSGWSNGSQTVAVSGLSASAKGTIGLAPTATTAQVKAASAALLMLTSQASGSVTVKAHGTVPTVDVPIQIIIVG